MIYQIAVGWIAGSAVAALLLVLLSNRMVKGYTAPRFNWSVGMAVKKTKTERKNRMLEIVITNEQKIQVTLTPVTATNKPAQLDGGATFEVISGTATIAMIDGNPLSAFLVSGDLPGDSEIMVSADADLGDGVETISDIIKLTVAGAKAASLGMTVGAPVAK
jgi:hypothetical protein